MDNKWPTGIRPRGNGLQLRIKHNGISHEIQIECNPHSKSDIKAAVDERDRIKAALKLGINPLEDEQKGLSRSFGHDAQEYLDQLQADLSTHLSYENLINRYWIPAFSQWPTSQITTKDIKKRLADFDVTIKTKRNALIPLRGILDYACVTPNPAKFKMQRHQKPKIDRFLPAERDLILRQLDGQYLVYFALLFGCGLRPGEAIGLKWCDYNGESLHIHQSIVRRKQKRTTKTHEARTVLVPHWVQKILNDHTTRFEGGHVFINSIGGHHVDTDRFNEQWHAVFKQKSIIRAGIHYRIPYVCRHTRAAEMLSMGIDPARASKELGHTVEMFLRTYSEFIDEYSNSGDREKLLGSGQESPDGGHMVDTARADS